MKPRAQHVVSILLGLTTVAGLFAISQSGFFPSMPYPGIWVIFTALVVLTTSFGIPIGGGEVSITPMIALTAALVMGTIPAAWAVVCGDLLYGTARYFWPEKTGWPRDQRGMVLIGTTAANVSMGALSLLAAGAVFRIFNGAVPADSGQERLVLVGAGASYIATNYLSASIFLLMRGKVHLVYLWKHIPRLLTYEVVPLLFAPLSAQIYFNQGWSQFILFAISLMMISFILRDQANSHKALQRRVQELDSLQAVGQALSASLEINTIAEAIYTEVSKLMPATNFYVALLDPETQEVTFPVVYELNIRLEWEPRKMAMGLTEYVLDTKQPLLIQKKVKEKVAELGLQHRGKEAISWLGVPMLAGEKALGMIVVQSYAQADRIEQTFDKSHLEILSTIAAQASVAIQNAYLYRHTDHALAMRVQELSSILSSTHEGILLLDLKMEVLEANRSLAEMLEEPLAKILQASLNNPDFSRCLGFKEVQAADVFNQIIAGELDMHRATVELCDRDTNTYERVISPVVGQDQVISGWLIVFRDLTEEIRLGQLREDLTRMLVHDLRSPMVTIQGGLDMIEIMINSGESKEELLEMVEISHRGGEQMLGMINELLSIHKFESGQLVLNLEPVILPDLFMDLCKSFTSLIKQVNIEVTTSFAPGLPVMVLDKALIRRLIHNLLDNAIKFTGDGGRIETWARPDPEEPSMVLFGVKDTGIGISQDIQEKLFQKYFSAGDKKSRRKGTGIGLYFSRLAVQSHGGTIRVESKPGKGSNFIVRMPIEAIASNQKQVP